MSTLLTNSRAFHSHLSRSVPLLDVVPPPAKWRRRRPDLHICNACRRARRSFSAVSTPSSHLATPRASSVSISSLSPLSPFFLSSSLSQSPLSRPQSASFSIFNFGRVFSPAATSAATSRTRSGDDVIINTTRPPPPPPPESPASSAHFGSNPAADEDIVMRCGGSLPKLSKMPFRFETGVGLFAKRQPRPFPPPFHSPPSASFSDALSTHDHSHDRRAFVGGQRVGGCTNGDDAVFASEYFIAANDGVGAWSMRPRGHAGLWARLVAHFWANAVYDEAVANNGGLLPPKPVQTLQRAYELTIEATLAPNDWQGTTTATGAQLSFREPSPIDESEQHILTDPVLDRAVHSEVEPLLYVTNLGDSQVMVVRPAERQLIFKTKEQWHWFDCPRQLGTNSPDTPRDNAVIDEVPIHVGDIVLAMSDGVIDNLWSHEIVEQVSKTVAEWQAKDKTEEDLSRGMMTAVAEELVEAARVIAVDPFAESPFMEHAIEEGLPGEGGKLDDISVVAAICRRNDTLHL